eukprot:scaffold995_cov358-Pavlova_lutheri.AAC.22
MHTFGRARRWYFQSETSPGCWKLSRRGDVLTLSFCMCTLCFVVANKKRNAMFRPNGSIHVCIAFADTCDLPDLVSGILLADGRGKDEQREGTDSTAKCFRIH